MDANGAPGADDGYVVSEELLPMAGGLSPRYPSSTSRLRLGPPRDATGSFASFSSGKLRRKPTTPSVVRQTQSYAAPPPKPPVPTVRSSGLVRRSASTSPRSSIGGSGPSQGSVMQRRSLAAAGSPRGPAAQRGTGQRITVRIIRATGLQHLNRFTGDAPYCVCSVRHQDRHAKRTQCQTKALKGTLDPEWDETFELEPWCGESLEFTIYDHGLMGSKTEGKAVLHSDIIPPSGFEGALPIEGLQHASIHVFVKPVSEAAPASYSSSALASRHSGYPGQSSNGLVAHTASAPPAAAAVAHADVAPPRDQVGPAYSVVLVGARGLPNADGFAAGRSDPYCICEVVSLNGKPRHQFVTKTVDNCLDPVWDQVFEVPDREPDDSLEFQVWDSNSVLSNTLLSKAVLPAADFSALLEGARPSLTWQLNLVPTPKFQIGGVLDIKLLAAGASTSPLAGRATADAGAGAGLNLDMMEPLPTKASAPASPGASDPLSQSSRAPVRSSLQRDQRKSFEQKPSFEMRRTSTSGGDKHLQRGISGVSRSVNVPVGTTSSRRVSSSRSVPGHAPEETGHQAAQKLLVHIGQAKGLKHLNHFTGDAPYCVCTVKHHEKHAKPSTCSTKLKSKSLDPDWNESHEIPVWHVGEPLEFAVFDKGLMGSKVEGRATLPSESFYPGGFEGEIPLEGKAHATLSIKVWPGGAAAAAEAAHISNQRHADAGLLDSLGGGTLCEIDLNSPDPVAVGVLGNVHCLLGMKDDWESVRASILAGSDLLDRMRSFDQSSVTHERLESLRRRQLQYPDSVVPAKVARVSEACAVLCVWVNSVCHRAGHTWKDETQQHRLEQLEHANQILEQEAEKECRMTAVPGHVPSEAAGHPVLYLRVLAAYNLKNRDSGLFGDVSDPFVVAKVGPVGQKTPAIQNNLNPVWEGMEGCEFAFTLEGDARVLELEVFNENHFKSHATLGRTRVDFGALPQGEWQRRREPLEDGGKGEIEFDVLLDIAGPQELSINAN